MIVINLPVNKRLRLIYNENKEGNIEIMPTNVTELFMDYEGSINQRSIYKAMYLFADEIVKSYYDKLKDYDDAQVKEYFSKNYNDIQRELSSSDNEFPIKFDGNVEEELLDYEYIKPEYNNDPIDDIIKQDGKVV